MGLKELSSNFGVQNDRRGGVNSKGLTLTTPPWSHVDQSDIYINPVTWDLNDPDAEPTYNDGVTRRNQSLVNSLDVNWRGGFSLSANRRLIDTKRMGNFFLSWKGIDFLGRQAKLQRMNPKWDAPMQNIGSGLLGLLQGSPVNQRTFNPINLMTQIGLGGMAMMHTKREGTLPFNERGYAKETEFLKNDVDKNRLLNLWNDKIYSGDASIPGLFDAQTGMGLLGRLATKVRSVLDKLGGKGEELFQYSGGPGSYMGLGRTFHGRYTNTVEIGGQLKRHLTYFSSRNVITKEDLKVAQRNYRENIAGANLENERGKKYGTGEKTSAFLQDPAPAYRKNKDDRIVKYGEKYDYSVYITQTLDKVNNFDVVRIKKGTIPHEIDYLKIAPKDFIPFYFEVLNTSNKDMTNDFIYFRAFLDNLSDSFKAQHNTFKYNGRAEEFYTYKGFSRGIDLSFKIAAQTRHEMMPLYRKLNYLVSNTAPDYDNVSGRIKTPFMRLTVGDWLSRIPGVLNSVSLKWGTDYPWEIRNDAEGYDNDMLILPHILDVSVSFTPVHTFTPQKGIKSPFILPDGKSTNLDQAQKWLQHNIAGADSKDEALKHINDEEWLEELDEEWDKDDAKAISLAGRNRIAGAPTGSSEYNEQFKVDMHNKTYGQGEVSPLALNDIGLDEEWDTMA